MVTRHQGEAVSCSVGEDTCMKGQSANEQMISQIQKILCIAQMGYKEKIFFQKRLKHLKTSVSRLSNFRYVLKFTSFSMEEHKFQGQIKEATQKYRGREDGITNNRCQTSNNQNLHCRLLTIKTKQQQKC